MSQVRMPSGAMNQLDTEVWLDRDLPFKVGLGQDEAGAQFGRQAEKKLHSGKPNQSGSWWCRPSQPGIRVARTRPVSRKQKVAIPGTAKNQHG